MTVLIPGWGIGAIEIFLFFWISFFCKRLFTSLYRINSLCYYWLCMTVLTGIWECSYLANYDSIVNYADELIDKNEHVWTNKYTFDYVYPWKLAYIFYGEYGAWADREYMSNSDLWSHTIEGTHAVFCASFALFGLIARCHRRYIKSLIVIGMAMAFQLMNSILYMVEYGIQCSQKTSVNYYNNSNFPLGRMMIERPFMYVNVFWLLCPTFILFLEIFCVSINSIKARRNKRIESSSNPNIEKPPAYEEHENEIKK